MHMRILCLFIVTLIVFTACKSNNNADEKNTASVNSIDPTDSTKFTTVQWIDSLVDFGSVKEGEDVDIKFRFKNTGNKPLIVASVVPGCGCTVPEYTKEPVMPGNEGFIKAKFHSSGQLPTVHKTISVAMNTKEQSYTRAFIGEVKK